MSRAGELLVTLHGGGLGVKALERGQHSSEDGGSGDPEKRVRAAVLTEAMDCYFGFAVGPAHEREQERENAEAWIASADRSDPYAFERICEELELEPEVVRRVLARGRCLQRDAEGERSMAA